MVALGWGGPPTDVTRDLPGPLSALFDLPGARYLLVVEESGDGDRVRAELGGAPDADLAVLDWARRLASISQERGRVFSDVVLTTEVAFHLARPLSGNRWVVLRLDREEGNLALARRALAGAAAPERPAPARPALDRAVSDRPALDRAVPDRPAPDRSGLRRLPSAGPSAPGPNGRTTGARPMPGAHPTPAGRPMPPDRLGAPGRPADRRPAALDRPAGQDR
ncbi:hypothetical protein ACFPBZ_26700, partial [Actinomycetospora atypica]